MEIPQSHKCVILICLILFSSIAYGALIPLVRRKEPHRRRMTFLMDNFWDPRISDDYFYAVMYVGSPPQRVELALDTASGLAYFSCKETCAHCGKHDDDPFIIADSSTFDWIDCDHSLCSGSCKNNPYMALAAHEVPIVCEWNQRYVDRSSIKASVASDLFSFYKYPYLPLDYYQVSVRNPSDTATIHPMEKQERLRLVFGCSEYEAKTIYRQTADGVMGMSMHHRSFVDQLFAKDQTFALGRQQFAHCFGIETGGLLMFGSNEIDQLIAEFNIELIWTPLITERTSHGWYKTKTVGFRVEYPKSTHSGTMNAAAAIDEPVVINHVSDEHAGYGGSVIDTGSSTLSMPRGPSKEIIAGILHLVHATMDKHAKDHKFEWVPDATKQYDFYLSWNGKSEFNEAEWQLFKDEMDQYFPDLVMLWRGEQGQEPLEFRIKSKQYLLFKKSRICLDLFGDTPSLLVGSNVMINKFMVYDREHKKLGVADIDCDQFTQSKDTAAESEQRRRPRVMDEPEPVLDKPDYSYYFDTAFAARSLAHSLTNIYTVYCAFLLLLVLSIGWMIRRYKQRKGRRGGLKMGKLFGARSRYDALRQSDSSDVDSSAKRKVNRRRFESQSES